LCAQLTRDLFAIAKFLLLDCVSKINDDDDDGSGDDDDDEKLS